MGNLQAFLSNFDHRTTLLLVSIAFFVQTAAIGAQAYLVKEYQGLGTALWGNLCMAFGFAFLLARNNLPDLLTIIIANLLIITSPLLYYVSISKFGEQTYSLKFIVTNLIAAGVLLIFYKYGTDSFAIRTIIVSFSSAITSFVIIYKLWWLRKHTFNISITLTIIPFILYGGYMAYQLIESILFPADQLFPDTPIQTGITTILYLISFLWTIGFMLMGSQRLQADLVKLATMDYLTRIPNPQSIP